MKILMILFCLFSFGLYSCGSENEPPNAPFNPYPADNSVGVPTHVNFSWQCTDPEGDKLVYKFWLSREDFPSITYDDYFSLGIDCVQPKYSMDLIPGTTYKWHVSARATEGTGGMVDSPIWFFTTESQQQHSNREGVVIVDETINVSAGSYKQYFISGKVGDNVHYELKSDSDVNIWFMSSGELSNFSSGKEFNQYSSYSGQRVLSLTKDFSLPATGSYYLIIDNTFSWITSKIVTIKIILG
jgi:hypothetical protein